MRDIAKAFKRQKDYCLAHRFQTEIDITPGGHWTYTVLGDPQKEQLEREEETAVGWGDCFPVPFRLFLHWASCRNPTLIFCRGSVNKESLWQTLALRQPFSQRIPVLLSLISWKGSANVAPERTRRRGRYPLKSRGTWASPWVSWDIKKRAGRGPV